MNDSPGLTTAARTPASRRRETRVDVQGRVSARSAGPLFFEVELVQDLSFGGFAIETQWWVPLGIRNRFEFETTSGFFVTVLARAVYCRRHEGTELYLSGWEFVSTPDSDRALEGLMEAATSVLSFDEPTSPS